jgi:glyoxylase-like metal-dependent hydrolase (beta-lactamase superfamily II)
MDEILKDIYTWSVYSEEKKLNFNGYFIASQHPLFGNVVIDPPQASDSDLEQMESLGFVKHIIITNRDHIRWSEEFQQKFGAEIQMNTNDITSSDMVSDRNFNHSDMIAGFLQAVVIPDNKSPGETALFWADRKILFLGDALIGKPPGTVTLLPEEKYDDILKAKAGIRILQNLDFKHLLLGDGDSILRKGKEVVSQYFN